MDREIVDVLPRIPGLPFLDEGHDLGTGIVVGEVPRDVYALGASVPARLGKSAVALEPFETMGTLMP